MVGLFSKIFDSVDPAGPEDLTGLAGNGQQSGDESAGRTDDEQGQEHGSDGASYQEGSDSESGAGAEAAVHADVSLALHNESETSWQDANGDTHSWGRATDVETGQEVDAAVSTDSGVTFNDGF
jgi:hypothetical protein